MRVRISVAGFTLVELVTVLAVMGILAVGTMRFMTDASSGYATTAQRAALTADLRATVVSLARDLRAALPGSVRVSGQCLEYVPVQLAGTALTMPLGYSSDRLVVAMHGTVSPALGYAAVVEGDETVYEFQSPGPRSPQITGVNPQADGSLQLVLAAPHEFVSASISDRIFYVDTPVSICIDDDALWQYQNYGWLGVQPDTVDLPGTAPGRMLLAEQVDDATSVFSVAAATLQRNAVVDIQLTLAQGGDDVAIRQRVHIRNSP